MFNMAVDFSILSSTVHTTALLLGAAVYLGYSVWPSFHSVLMNMRLKAASCSADHEDEQQCRPRRPFARRDAAAAVAIAALLVGVVLSATNSMRPPVPSNCPPDLDDQVEILQAPEPIAQPAAPAAESEEELKARLKMRSPGAFKFNRQHAQAPAAGSPSDLLAQARATKEASTDASAAWSLLESCVVWAPAEGEAPASELHAQLQCNRLLIESGATTREAALALLARSRQLAQKLSALHDLDAGIQRQSQVEFAGVAHSAFQLNCRAVADELLSSRRAKTPGAVAEGARPARTTPAALMLALRSLKRLEAPYRETLAAAKQALQSFEVVSDAANQHQELNTWLGADRACAMQALQQGRLTAVALPRSSPSVRKIMQCRPRMLTEFQQLALTEATEAKDAATMFNLGLYYSDVGMAEEDKPLHVPLFGPDVRPVNALSSEPTWAADAGGTHAPSRISEAEELMLKGEEASPETERGDRAAARALRLYQHAKMLALKHHDSAAEWRYEASAKLAAMHRRQQLAAHALGRLSYFLSLRGRRDEALESAMKALEHVGEDALAQYMQVSLRRTLGLMTTTEEVLSAETKLSLVAGRLPSKQLEDQRAAACAELMWWRTVATDGLQVCYKAWDAAQTLICVMSGLIFDLPEAASTLPQ